jgi:hypothetical protein
VRVCSPLPIPSCHSFATIRHTSSSRSDQLSLFVLLEPQEPPKYTNISTLGKPSIHIAKVAGAMDHHENTRSATDSSERGCRQHRTSSSASRPQHTYERPQGSLYSDDGQPHTRTRRLSERPEASHRRMSGLPTQLDAATPQGQSFSSAGGTSLKKKSSSTSEEWDTLEEQQQDVFGIPPSLFSPLTHCTRSRTHSQVVPNRLTNFLVRGLQLFMTPQVHSHRSAQQQRPMRPHSRNPASAKQAGLSALRSLSLQTNVHYPY